MSIPLTGTGGLFTRMGVIGGTINAINTARGTTVPSHIGNVQSQFTSTDQNLINSLYSYLSAYQTSGSSLPLNLKSVAQSVLIQMANDSATLPSSRVSNALSAVITQMKATSQTVSEATVSSSVSYAGTNTGNPVAVVSLLDTNGYSTQLAYAESITGTVLNDYQSQASLAGVEPISIIGQQAVPDVFSWLYPGGSGVSSFVSAVSGQTSAQGGAANWLTNGSMETWTSNVPSGWHITVGTAGSTVLQATGTVYDGISSLEYVGNGSELTTLCQQFSIAGKTYDTPIVIYPNTQFAVNLFLYVPSVPASGVLRVALSDGTNPTTDNAGNTNAFNVDLGTLTAATWTPVSGTFRTPNKLPTSGVFLELKLTTALPSGDTLYIDRAAFAQMSRLYPGGPSLSIFSGNLNMIRGDTLIVNLSNNYANGFQILFDRLFGLKSSGVLLPYSASPTISDSLIA